MARKKGTLNLSSNLEPSMNAPLDAREVVNTINDLTDSASFPYFYEGMTVYVKAESKSYTLVGNDTTDFNNWEISGGGSEEVHIGDTAPTDGEDIWIDTDEEDITEIPFDIITHKPSIEGHTLQGNKTASDLGLAKVSDIVSNVGDMDDVEITSIEDGQILKYNSTTQKWENADDEGGSVDSVNGKTGVVVLDATDVGALSDDTSIPSTTSDLTNDSGFIDKSVNDLNNYTTTTDLNTALNGKVNTSSIGVASGVAELDASGKVPSSQLPSYVDDVVEGYYKESDGKFYEESTYETEIVGESDKIYISVDTNIQYRWNGNGYSALGGALQLGETSSTAYRGDRGKSAYDHSQLTSGNPHNVTKTDVGLGNVDNTSDLDKPISTATQTALNNKVDVESGKGLSTNDYTTAEKEKLNDIEAGAEENIIETIMINGSAQTATNKTVNLLLTKENVGLGNVDNTSDLDKPVSTATQTALNSKQDTIQIAELPTLTVDINGKIYQYIGTDETTYKTGHFYKAVYIGEDIRWQDVTTEIDDTTSSTSTTYSSAKIDSLIPSADIYVGATAPTNGETIWIDTSEDY